MNDHYDESTLSRNPRVRSWQPLPGVASLCALLVLAPVLAGQPHPRVSRAREYWQSGRIMRTATASAVGSPVLHGWIYVLDPNKGNLDSQILVLNPNKGSIEKVFRAGYAPEMALSPDGSRLYLASFDPSDEPPTLARKLFVIDTTTETVLKKVDDPDHPAWGLEPPFPSMVTSKDGRWLYVLRRPLLGRRQDAHVLAVFDTLKERFLPDTVDLGECVPGQINPFAKDWNLSVLCGESNVLHLLTMSQNEGLTRESTIPLPSEDPNRAAYGARYAALAPDETTGLVVMGEGAVLSLDLQSRKVTNDATLPLADALLTFGRAVMAPDGRRLYLPVRSRSNRFNDQGMHAQIIVVDISSGRAEARITTSLPFWSIVVTPDGRRLYATVPLAQTVLVIDTDTLREVQKFSGIGNRPALMAIQP